MLQQRSKVRPNIFVKMVKGKINNQQFDLLSKLTHDLKRFPKVEGGFVEVDELLAMLQSFHSHFVEIILLLLFFDLSCVPFVVSYIVLFVFTLCFLLFLISQCSQHNTIIQSQPVLLLLI